MNPAPPPAIFEQVAWQLRYGVPAERRRAATQLIALSEQQPPEVRHHVETLLWEQSQREPHADLRSFLQTAALRFKVARFRGAHSTRSDRRLAMGSIVRTLRIKAGLSTTALCARCGLHRDSLRYMERGVREEPLANYLKVFHALAGHVTPVLRVRFYEQWNMELRELPWYDWKAHRYEVRLPDGWTIEEALAKTPGEVIALRIDSLKLSRPRLVIESGLKRWRLWDLIHGRLKRPPLALLRQLAPMLQLDASLLYLLAHPEIPGFVAVVESGSYARAAQTLHKSQSTITYAVQRIQELLGIALFEIKGRKAVLTATGQLLYQRGRALVDEADLLERSARALSAGWEAEIGVAVDHLLPSAILLEALAQRRDSELVLPYLAPLQVALTVQPCA